MYVLSGFFAITENDTGFLIPYFYRRGSNHTFVQDLVHGYIISKFKAVNLEGLVNVNFTCPGLELNEGMQAIIAFRVDGQVYYGNIKDIRELNIEKLLKKDKPIFNSALSVLFLDKHKHDSYVEESSRYFGPFSEAWKSCEKAGYNVNISFQDAAPAKEKTRDLNKYNHFLNNPDRPSWAQEWFIAHIHNRDDPELLDMGMWWLSSYSFDWPNIKSSPALVIYALLDVVKFRDHVVPIFHQWFSMAIAQKNNSRVNLDLFGGLSRSGNRKNLISSLVLSYLGGDERHTSAVSGRSFRSFRFDLSVLMTSNEKFYIAIDVMDRIGKATADTLKIVKFISGNDNVVQASRRILKGIILNSKTKDRNWCEICALYINKFSSDDQINDLAMIYAEHFVEENANYKNSGIKSVTGWLIVWEALERNDNLRVRMHKIGSISIFSKSLSHNWAFYVRCWPRVFLRLTENPEEGVEYEPYIFAAKEWLKMNHDQLRLDWKYKEIVVRVEVMRHFSAGAADYI